MEIHVFTVSGSVHRFEQTDAKLAGQNRSRIAPEKFFSQPVITIAGTARASGFPSRAVLRVEIVMEPRPDWPFAPNLTDLALITEQEYRDGSSAAESEVHDATTAGQPFVAYGVLEDASGAMHHLVARGTELPGAVRKYALTRVLEGACIHLRRGEDTTVLMNPANVVRLSIPGLQDVPATALLADCLE